MIGTGIWVGKNSKTVAAPVIPLWFTAGVANNVLLIGDSFVRGSSASDPATKGWAGLLSTSLRSLLGDAGNGCQFLEYRGQAYSDNFLNWTEVGSANGTHAYALYGTDRTLYAGGANAKSATITISGKTFVLFHYATETQDNYFNIVVDGGAPTLIQKAHDHTPHLFTDNITTASNASHTIEISNAIYIDVNLGGLLCYNGNAGVNMTKIAYSGCYAGALMPTGYELSFEKHMDFIQPKLTIINFGYNEYDNQQALATFKSSLATLVDAAGTYGTVYLLNCTDYKPGNPIPISSYNTKISEVCTENGATLIDVATPFGTEANAIANGWITSDLDNHPTDSGHQKIHDIVYAAIT